MLVDFSVTYTSKKYGLYHVSINNLANEGHQEALDFPGIACNVRTKWSNSF